MPIRKFIVREFPNLRVFDTIKVDKYYISTENDIYYFREHHGDGKTEYGIGVGETSDFRFPLSKSIFEAFAYNCQDVLNKEIIVCRLENDEREPITLVEVHCYPRNDNLSILQIESTISIIDDFEVPSWTHDAPTLFKDSDLSYNLRDQEILDWRNQVSISLQTREKKLGSTFEERLQRAKLRKEGKG